MDATSPAEPTAGMVALVEWTTDEQIRQYVSTFHRMSGATLKAAQQGQRPGHPSAWVAHWSVEQPGRGFPEHLAGCPTCQRVEQAVNPPAVNSRG